MDTRVCIYNTYMQFTWHEAKRHANLKVHGIDFVDASLVFDMKSTVSRSEMRPGASKPSSSKASRTDVERLTKGKARPTVTDEHPEADVKHIVQGIVRRGLKPVPAKASISLRVDADVLEWFKSQGDGYQTRMNAVLRAFRDASNR